MDEIVVSPFNCVEPSMWLALHGMNAENSDVVGKVFVQPEYQVVVPRFGNIHMKEKLAGVHVRVSSAASYNADIAFKYLL